MVDTAALAPAIRRANSKALEILLQGDPVLIDVVPAKDLIPELKEHTILHAGPPIEWTGCAVPCGVLSQGWRYSKAGLEILTKPAFRRQKGASTFIQTITFLQ